MTLGFGRIVPGSQARHTQRVEVNLSQAPRASSRWVPAEVVDAAQRAARIVAEAFAEAESLRNRAAADMQSLRAQAVEDAKAHGAARLAAETLALAAREAESDARSLDRSVELARLLAERLLGEALTLEPAHIEAIARRALSEASGARRICIAAHPEDVPALQAALDAGRFSYVAQIRADFTRNRGSLRFETEIGTLDADIAPQLERLADRLRQALHHER